MLSAAEVAEAFEQLQGLLVGSELTAFRTLTATLFDGSAGAKTCQTGTSNLRASSADESVAAVGSRTVDAQNRRVKSGCGAGDRAYHRSGNSKPR